MRKSLPILFLLICSTTSFVFSQDIPLFSQKLTNSFVYNPAIAGHTVGSFTASYKQNYAQVEGAPKNYFLSMHTPIANYRFGIGANVYQEEVTFLKNMYASLAFAYHVRINKFATLSMGVAGEYNEFGINGLPNYSNDLSENEEWLDFKKNGIKDFDFSSGLHFQNRFIKAGIAANRMSTTWIKGENRAVLSNFYSASLQGLIPLRSDQDLLEPYVAYRKLSTLNNTLDAGAYYTINKKVTLGGAYRTGGVGSGTVAYRLSKYLLVGYSYETIVGNVGGFVGAANEITLRFDFNDQAYKAHFSSDYKSSVAYRRKALSSSKKRPAARSPKQVAKKQKKLAPYSPNRRYQNTKKLSVKKFKSKRGSYGGVKKRKKVGSYKRKPRRR